MMTSPTELPIWRTLAEHANTLKSQQLINHFNSDPHRVEKFTLCAGPLRLDYSKNHITQETHALLIQLAKDSHVAEKRAALFAGEKINVTEQRAVLHTELRKPMHLLKKEVREERQKMYAFTDAVHTQQYCGRNGQPFDTVVNIGIGGSHLGPQMVVHALQATTLKLKAHFIANIDNAALWQVLQQINPDTTLFVVASKTFTTQETMTNAETLRAWLLQQGWNAEDLQRHFVAVTTATEKAQAFGISADRIFSFWDWVGGRYSLWSSIGLSIALALGAETFDALLSGAHEMDEHFLQTPLCHNMPVLLALLGHWYRQYFQADTHALIPYAQSLQYFPDYLQQLDMESNGKSVSLNNQLVDYPTGPIVWGGVGTNGQHAFHQLLHQGTTLVPIDFLLPMNSPYGDKPPHALVVAHCLAQAQALMVGTPNETIPYKQIPGNKPSNIITFEQLDARTLGALLALYEHKVFTQGILWQINSFDQWGVELGKKLANDLIEILTHASKDLSHLDNSTAQLVQQFFMLHHALQNREN